jgi:hypothetical protein
MVSDGGHAEIKLLRSQVQHLQERLYGKALNEHTGRVCDFADLLAQARAEVERLRAAILDIDSHATPYGDLPEEPGYVGTYLVTAGALHRALGKIGHTAPKCTAEAQVERLTQENTRLQQRLEAAWEMGDRTAQRAIMLDAADRDVIEKAKAAVNDARLDFPNWELWQLLVAAVDALGDSQGDTDG